MRILFVALAALLPALLSAQTLNDSSLNGRYGFVHYWVDVNSSGFANDASNLGGVMTFDGNGGYSFQGQLGSGSAAATASTGTGSYSVSSNGFLRIESPINRAIAVNARVGDLADVLLGSSTEGPSTVYDFFVAVRLPDSGGNNGLLSGAYTGASLWLPNGSDLSVKTALVKMTPNGNGAFSSMLADGHAADQGDVPQQQTISGATYSVSGDGTGSLSLGSSSSLFQGSRTLFVSMTGNYVVGFSTAAGARDVFIAIRNLGSGASNGSFSGGFWVVDLFNDRSNSRYNAAVGGLSANGAGVVSLAQRLKGGTNLDFSGVNSYGVSSDGSGYLRNFPAPTLSNFALGAAGARPAVTEEGVAQTSGANGFVAAEVAQNKAFHDIHGLSIGVRMPQLSGSGVFLNPLGVVNAASFAPTTHPVSPGTMLSLFGTELADGFAQPSSVPLPTQVDGVSVTFNGIQAPLFFVSPGQINLQAPFALQGETVDIVVRKNGQASNTVQAPLGATSPGVFTVQQTGFGPGIITHSSDFSLITAQSPAQLGEVVTIFLTGMGATTPPVADGAQPPSAEPFARTTVPIVQFGGVAGEVFFSGSAP
ncbi:MAG: hypothetical protein KDC27_18235 [Acidobacteria bacterium]|nr:hypothetical protein [Acidobacteriota bacterium]